MFKIISKVITWTRIKWSTPVYNFYGFIHDSFRTPRESSGFLKNNSGFFSRYCLNTLQYFLKNHQNFPVYFSGILGYMFKIIFLKFLRISLRLIQFWLKNCKVRSISNLDFWEFSRLVQDSLKLIQVCLFNTVETLDSFFKLI